MKVLKFGGTSVADIKSLNRVVEIIKENEGQIVVVVSALSGITNILERMAKLASEGSNDYKDHIGNIERIHLNPIESFIPLTQQSEVISFLKSQLIELEEVLESLFTLKELTSRSLSKILSYGEVLSSNIIFHILNYQDCEIILKDARELIFTHTIFDKEVVNHKQSIKSTKKFFKNKKFKITLIPGFIAQDEERNTTTLGRGGSDYTASLLANYCDASKLEIWTDVSGMYTANPRLVSQAVPIAKLSY